MAKLKKKRNTEITTVIGTLGAEGLGLLQPFGSCPSRPPKIGIYMTKGENQSYKGFYAMYAARKFLDVLFEDEGLTRIKGITGEDDTVLTESGMSIRIYQHLDELLTYKYSTDEEKWELPENYVNDAIRFRSMGFDAPNYAAKDPDAPKAERVKKEPKEKRPSKEGLVTIQQIAEELKMEPREARGILRKMKTLKPELGWCWAPAESVEIKKLVEKNREK